MKRPRTYPENTGTNSAGADKISNMIEALRKFFCLMVLGKQFCLLVFFIFFGVTSTLAQGQPLLSAESTELEVNESPPVAFPSSYIGLLLNQNHPYSYGKSEYSRGGASWGAEYRFFYKDTWTLAITGSFKQLEDVGGGDAPLFALSQETLRLVRLYHPWYFCIGARLLYFIPVRRIMLPYERDQSRAIDTGAALTTAIVWKSSNKSAYLLSVNRWRSLSTNKKQGLEITGTALFTIR